ncbi:MAG: hypothetical protein P4L87_16145, partial [Formivibrio sp.]|nr:hypothetical protein [Formivibrio sp.]
ACGKECALGTALAFDESLHDNQPCLEDAHILPERPFLHSLGHQESFVEASEPPFMTTSL